MFSLSRRFGGLADRYGPHWFMGGGPIVAGAGLLLFTRIGEHAPYLTTVLPGVLVFGLGLAATVAPLTATVLGAVEPGHSGVASGVNNAVARVAGLLAIAALGAVVSASYAKSFVTATPGVAPGARVQVHQALADASVYAFHFGLIIAAVLAILGGVVALVGIENPRRRVPCVDCPGGALAGASKDLASRRAPQPQTAGAPAATS
jgi:MFS family permease